MSEPSSILGMHHIGISVSNLEQSIEFYSSLAALERLDIDSLGGRAPIDADQSAVMKGPNGFLQLMQFSGKPDNTEVAVEGPGVTHLCFQSPAEDALFQKFLDNGARSVSEGEPPIDLNGRGVRYGYARDADNIMYEVEQLDKPNFEGPIWVAHIALVTPDLDRSVEFYRNLLGVEPYGLVNKIVGPKFDEVTGLKDVRLRVAWFNTGNMIIEIWQYVNPKTAEPTEPLAFNKLGFNKIALEVGDLDAECARLQHMGVEALNERESVNGVTEVYFRDPDGNLLSLLSVDSDSIPRVVNLEQISWLPSPSNPKAGA